MADVFWWRGKVESGNLILECIEISVTSRKSSRMVLAQLQFNEGVPRVFPCSFSSLIVFQSVNFTLSLWIAKACSKVWDRTVPVILEATWRNLYIIYITYHHHWSILILWFSLFPRPKSLNLGTKSAAPPFQQPQHASPPSPCRREIVHVFPQLFPNLDHRWDVPQSRPVVPSIFFLSEPTGTVLV